MKIYCPFCNKYVKPKILIIREDYSWYNGIERTILDEVKVCPDCNSELIVL